jgi:cytochrome c-type biogenesis protein
VIDAPLAYAFGVGMVATFNPCGFAMLPAYVSYFLGLEGATAPEARRGSVRRALAIGAAMTGGFLVVFGVLGVVFDSTLSALVRHLPWVTMVLGVGLVILGGAMLAGRTFTANLPKLTKGTESRELWSVFLFGVSYALVSLSCTLPLFMAVVSTRFTSADFVSGLAVFLAYGLGMGLVLTALTLAVALARQGMVLTMKRVLPYVNRISGGLLVVAGIYVAYYGWYQQRVEQGDFSAGGPASWVSARNADVSNWIQDVGPLRIGLVLALIIAVALTVSLAWQASRPDRPPTTGADRPDEVGAGR